MTRYATELHDVGLPIHTGEVNNTTAQRLYHYHVCTVFGVLCFCFFHFFSYSCAHGKLFQRPLPGQTRWSQGLSCCTNSLTVFALFCRAGGENRRTRSSKLARWHRQFFDCFEKSIIQ